MIIIMMLIRFSVRVENERADGPHLSRETKFSSMNGNRENKFSCSADHEKV